MNKNVLINAHNISAIFNHRLVLDKVSLELLKGQILTIIGPNGAGKSTLLKILLGLLKPTEGRIHLKPNIRIGYMPQKLNLEPLMPLTVERFLKLAKSSLILDETLQLLSIEHLSKFSVQTLSGGELQRVILARALMNNPELLVLDEPAQGIDVRGQAELYSLIKDISIKKGCGILMVSHDLHIVMSGTDSVICLNQHVCCQGIADDISKHPEFLQLFGIKNTEGLAVYHHHHNHHHSLGGDVCN
ncbi:MAG: znuC [Francisellaceae bacterium]|nr:znuC [Francisellaceae bacterium]